MTKSPEADASSQCTKREETFSKEESCSVVECAGVKGVRNTGAEYRCERRMTSISLVCKYVYFFQNDVALLCIFFLKTVYAF